MTNRTFSPFPDPGNRVHFTWRRAVWVVANPRYGVNGELADLITFWHVDFWWPFFSFRTGKIHGYIGWKPNTLDDPGFYWSYLKIARKWHAEERLIVELSIRLGSGAVS